MAGFDLGLVNGRLVTSAGIHEVDVAIREGRVAAIGAWGTLPDAGQIVDLTGRVILPGGIDTHAHGGDPGAFDFGEVSMAAALGGVTTIVDMAIQIPLTTDAATFDAKLAVIGPNAHVDFALWATLAPDGAGAIQELKERGAVGIKLVMQRSVEGVMPLYQGMQALYPERVLVRGQNVVLDGKLCGRRGDREFCVPVKASPADS